MVNRSAAAIPLFQRLEIETQSNCNRSCWFCPRTYDRSGTYIDASGAATLTQMPTATVIGLLDQAAALGFTGKVAFHFFSEALLDKRNTMFAQAARERGMSPFIHTNGDALAASDRLCEDVKRSYDEIVVGLYDYTSAEELATAKTYWRDRLAGTELKFIHIRPVADRGLPSLGTPRALTPSDERAAFPDLTFANGPCSRPLLRMPIRYDGAFCLCCEDLHAQFGLGNVHASSLEDLWFSDRHVRIVRDLLEGRRGTYDLCRTCPLTPTGTAPDGGKIAMARRDNRMPA